MPRLNALTPEQIVALIEDPAIRNFDRCMDEAESSIAIYMELRRSRGVVDSDLMQEHHQDIIGVTKSGLVASLSALDALIHAILKSSLPAQDFEKLRYKTFQSSKQIASALRLLGLDPSFSSVSPSMSSDLYSPSDVASNLDAYYARKNLITHHADTDEMGSKIAFEPSDALSCVRFVRDFGHAFHVAAFRV